MKRRETKKRIRKVGRLLAEDVRGYLTTCRIDNSHDSDEMVASICTWLSSLLARHLALHSGWPDRERWVDGISSPEIAVQSTGVVYVRGDMWWGLSNNLSGALRSETFLATVRLCPSGKMSYQLIFANDYCFSSPGKA